MSRRKKGGGRRKQQRATTQKGRDVSTIVEVNGLPGVHMTLEVLGMTAEDVAEARRQAAACNIEHELVQRMVCAYVEGFELEPDGPEWSAGEMATLLQALGLLPDWTTATDVELAHLLGTEQAGGRS